VPILAQRNIILMITMLSNFLLTLYGPTSIIRCMTSVHKKLDCPYCGEAMRPVVMACDRCDVEVRGRFRHAQFARLSDEDLAFLERYLLADFSIKALAEESGLGYVALRKRLDHLLDSYRALQAAELGRLSVLERLEKGELSAAEAAQALERI